MGATVNGILEAGRAYLFDGETGNLLLDIPNPMPTAGAGFGWSVAALDGRIVVSTPNGNADGLAGTGAVYVFEGIPEPGAAVMGVVGVIFAMILYRVRAKGISRL